MKKQTAITNTNNSVPSDSENADINDIPIVPRPKKQTTQIKRKKSKTKVSGIITSTQIPDYQKVNINTKDSELIEFVLADFYDFHNVNELQTFSKMTELNLISEFVSDLKLIIQNIPNKQIIKSMCLNENQITSLEGIEELENLENLQINFNQITEINESVFKLKNLKKLWLCENKIKEIKNVPLSTESLWLANNLIEKFPDNFAQNYEKLKELNIAGNCILDLENIYALENLANLKKLYFSDVNFGENPICNITNYRQFTLHNLDKIEILDQIKIASEEKKLVEAVYIKKKLIYQNKIRHNHKIAKMAFHLLRTHKLFINSIRLQRAMFFIQRKKMLEYARYEKKNFYTKGQTNLDEIENEIQSSEIKARQCFELSDIISKNFKDLKQYIMMISDLSIVANFYDLETNGNFKIDSGNISLKWVRSCMELMKFKVTPELLSKYGYNSINFNKIFKISNRINKIAFDLIYDVLVDENKKFGEEQKSFDFFFMINKEKLTNYRDIFSLIFEENKNNGANSKGILLTDNIGYINLELKEANAELNNNKLTIICKCANFPSMIEEIPFSKSNDLSTIEKMHKFFEDYIENSKSDKSIFKYKLDNENGPYLYYYTIKATVAPEYIIEYTYNVLKDNEYDQDNFFISSFNSNVEISENHEELFNNCSKILFDKNKKKFYCKETINKYSISKFREFNELDQGFLFFCKSSLLAFILNCFKYQSEEEFKGELNKINEKITEISNLKFKLNLNNFLEDVYKLLDTKKKEEKENEAAGNKEAIENEIKNNENEAKTNENSEIKTNELEEKEDKSSKHNENEKNTKDKKKINLNIPINNNNNNNNNNIKNESEKSERANNIDKLKILTSITEINLFNQNYTNEKLENLCKKLKEQSYLHEEIKAFRENITSLVISKNNLESIDLNFLQDIFPNMINLDVSDNNIKAINIKVNADENMIDNLKIKLQSIDISFNSINNFKDIYTLLKCIPSLKILKFYGNSFEKSFEIFTENFPPNFEYSKEMKDKIIEIYDDILKQKQSENLNIKIQSEELPKNLSSNKNFDYFYESFSFSDIFHNFSNNKHFREKTHKENNLSTVILTKKKLFKIPLIENKSDAQVLFINLNKISQITNLEQFNELLELYIQNNRIQKIENLPKSLKKLDISNNELNNIKEISICQNLEWLNIENNLVQNVIELVGLPNLIEIYCSGNLLTNIKELCQLGKIKKLEILDVSGNEICRLVRDLRVTMIYYCKALKNFNRINVDNAERIKAKEYFTGKLTSEVLEKRLGIGYNTKNLVELDLSSLKLKDEHELFDKITYPKLVKLNLSRNIFKSFTIFGHLPLLVELNLNYNLFVEIFPKQSKLINGKGIFGLSNLESLELAGNQIANLNGIQFFKKLKILVLRENNIMKIDPINRMEFLTFLDVSSNKLRNCDKSSIGYLPALQVFLCDNNYLKNVNGFDRFFNIQSLSFENNKLSDFNSLEKLSVLQNLKDISFLNNPLSKTNNYRNSILRLFPNLIKLDSREVTSEEREMIQLEMQMGDEDDYNNFNGNNFCGNNYNGINDEQIGFPADFITNKKVVYNNMNGRFQDKGLKKVNFVQIGYMMPFQIPLFSNQYDGNNNNMNNNIYMRGKSLDQGIISPVSIKYQSIVNLPQIKGCQNINKPVTSDSKKRLNNANYIPVNNSNINNKNGLKKARGISVNNKSKTQIKSEYLGLYQGQIQQDQGIIPLNYLNQNSMQLNYNHRGPNLDKYCSQSSQSSNFNGKKKNLKQIG